MTNVNMDCFNDGFEQAIADLVENMEIESIPNDNFDKDMANALESMDKLNQTDTKLNAILMKKDAEVQAVPKKKDEEVQAVPIQADKGVQVELGNNQENQRAIEEYNPVVNI
jgi:hypothetical protein